MEFRKVQALRGPNIWARFPVLEVWVDLGDRKDTSSDEVPGFNDRLMLWLPSMIEHRCSVGERGGFFERLRRGTYLAHILEHVSLELQSLAGTPVGYGRARMTSEDGVYKVAIQYKEEELARACVESARQLCLAAWDNTPFDVTAEVERLRNLAHQLCLGPSTASIVKAARARWIPTRRLNSGSLVQLGYGSKARRILTAETDQTGAIAEQIAQDKDLTRTLLRAIGVPVAYGRPVNDADDAWAAAEELGTPVVVKPQYGNQGRGVATNLTTRDQVETAYAAARQESGWIIVETFAPGDDYRLLVIGGKLVAAARREPAQVIGDAQRTITQLIDEVNSDPRRGEDHATVLSKIKIDPIALAVLAEQGYTPDSVPPTGARVLIRRNANLSTGGTATDVTDLVHPEVAARAIEAARCVGLDIAGVDVVATNISRPLEEQNGIVVEVNAGPGLRMHLEPSAGSPRPVGEAIVDSLFPEGETGRIPIVAVTGTNGKTTTTRLITHILHTSGQRVGMTCTDGIYIDGRRIYSGDCSGPLSARDVLTNPIVDAAVLETARGGILRSGLGFDRCQVAVVTNIGEGDHLGLNEIDTPEQLAWVKQTLPDNVLPTGTAVLKADDPLTAAMASSCPGRVLYFARDPKHPLIAEHRAAGRPAAFIRDETIVVCDAGRETEILPVVKIPLTHGGRIGFQIENCLAAAAAAWAVGAPIEAIRTGLLTFAGDTQHAPGRFNVMEANGAVVIVDYGHNPDAVAALAEAVEQFPCSHRSIIFTVAGDRRDVDIVRQGEIVGRTFDRLYLYEDGCLRGRPDGQITQLIRQGISPNARAQDIRETRGEMPTVETALNLLRPGDLLVVQPDKIDKTIAFIQTHLAARPPRADKGGSIDVTPAETLPADTSDGPVPPNVPPARPKSVLASATDASAMSLE